MTAVNITLSFITLTFLGLFLTYRRRLHRATCRDMGFSIRTVRLHEFDPRFEASPLGVAHGAEVGIVPAVGKVVGGTNEREAWILAAMAKGASCLFEFGTAGGRTAYHWARNAPPDAEIATLTLHPDERDEPETAPGDSRLATRNARREACFDQFIYSGSDVAEKITQLFGDSKEFDERDWVGRCDLVFVDGSHALSYVQNDSEKALRMLKPGGVALWHDYRGDSAGRDVRRFLDALARKLPLVRLSGTHLVAYRAPG